MSGDVFVTGSWVPGTGVVWLVLSSGSRAGLLREARSATTLAMRRKSQSSQVQIVWARLSRTRLFSMTHKCPVRRMVLVLEANPA
jgi:hypothetical protein